MPRRAEGWRRSLAVGLASGRNNSLRQTIRARWILGPSGLLEHPELTVEEGRIVSLETGRPPRPSRPTGEAAGHWFDEALLIPSYIDIHVHGAAGHDLMEPTPEALSGVAGYLASRGVGAYFPTTVTSSTEKTLRALNLLADAIESDGAQAGARPLGIHLEGPFLSTAKRGVHPVEWLRAPSIALFDRFWQAARGHIRLMTIAAELPGSLDLIAHASACGVRCSVGHSNATYQQAAAAIDAGARSATHTYNAMRPLDHRDPGLIAYVLNNDRLFAEIICDGVHVDPAMVRLFARARGLGRSILITDGISATGMPDGAYMLGSLEVEVREGRCTSGGSLAGSVLTMDRAVRNFTAFTGSDLADAVTLATRNPASLVGIEDQWGALEPGREANITVLSASGDVLQSFRAGRPVLP